MLQNLYIRIIKLLIKNEIYDYKDGKNHWKIKKRFPNFSD